jgi:hypothetical protein
MATHLNNYFGLMINIIECFGGDILKFGSFVDIVFGDSVAGDALLVIWRFDSDSICSDQEQQFAMEAAFRCSAVLVSTLHAFEVAHDIVLSLHCAVASGSAIGLHVGGVDKHWEYFVTGSFFSALHALLDVAGPGTVSLSHVSYATIEKSVSELVSTSTHLIDVSQAGSTGAIVIIPNEKKTRVSLSTDVPLSASIDSEYRLLPPTLARVLMSQRVGSFVLFLIQKGKRVIACKILDQKIYSLVQTALRSYIPKSVLESAGSGDNGTEDLIIQAEYRKVSVVFVGLPFLEANSFALDVAQDVLVIVQELLKRYDGTLRQILTDDKGTVIIAAFGAPPFSHVDDAKRAVLFAYYLQRALVEAMDLSLSGSNGSSTPSSGSILIDSMPFEITRSSETPTQEVLFFSLFDWLGQWR